MSTEYIERDSLIAWFENLEVSHLARDYVINVYVPRCLEDKNRFPAADVALVVHGEWREETEYYDDEYSECNVRKVFACSLCGRTERTKQPFCNCGAKMDRGNINE